jgi:hypothetical protein
MRMYVLDGKCSFGVMTRFKEAPSSDGHDGPLLMTATGPGRQNWLRPGGGAEAAAMAEQVVTALCEDQAGAGHFLRVDLIRRSSSDGGWWLNELEFFGNAFLMFEAFDNAAELLDATVECTKRWVRALIAK